MAHLQLTAVAGGRDDEMEEVALLGSYGEAEGPSSRKGQEEEEAGMRRAQVRVTGMTCSACTGAVEAALSARRGVRSAAVSLLQNRAHVVFDPALAKVWFRVIPPPPAPSFASARAGDLAWDRAPAVNSGAVASSLYDYSALVGNQQRNWSARGGKLSCVLSVMVVRMRNQHSQLVL